MAFKHGVYVSEQATSVSTPVVADSGLPIVFGVAPIQSASTPAKVGVPCIATSWDEAVEKLGYSEDWESYTLCEFMYSHFKLFACQPVIFVNVLDPSKSGMKEEVAATDLTVTDGQIKLPIDALADTVEVKPAGGTGTAYTLDTDYSVYYSDNYLYIEVLEDGTCAEATTLNVAYSKAKPSAVTTTMIAAAVEATDQCLTLLGTVPDLLCAPGFSHDTVVAAVMTTKAGSINGLFQGKAIIDIDSSADGATAYDQVNALKNNGNFVDTDEIVCWPMLTLGDYKFHLSTQLAGLMAQIDTDNGGAPYETPGNKTLQCDGMCLEDGTEVSLTHAQANILNANGIVTALNFMGGWVAWGNYTGCYPTNTDVKDYFIPISRMFKWVGNTLIKTFWGKLDKPMNRRLIDCILDSSNIWLNGLVGQGYLLGARVEMDDAENPLTSLMAGIIKLHVYITPPSPAQEIDFVLEYDVSYVEKALES